VCSWRFQTYSAERTKQEERGETRWEFERQRLFFDTRYMAQVCSNLLDIVEKIEEFKGILQNPELKGIILLSTKALTGKAVTGDIAGIESVLSEVELMIKPITEVPFAIFEKMYSTRYESAEILFILLCMSALFSIEMYCFDV